MPRPSAQAFAWNSPQGSRREAAFAIEGKEAPFDRPLAKAWALGGSRGSRAAFSLVTLFCGFPAANPSGALRATQFAPGKLVFGRAKESNPPSGAETRFKKISSR
jgi:hypothetical protein